VIPVELRKSRITAATDTDSIKLMRARYGRKRNSAGNSCLRSIIF